MQKADYDRFVDILNAVSDTVGKRRLTELAIGLYWKTLEAYSLADIQLAVERHLQDPEVGQYMPKPADVIRALQGTVEDRALAAWPVVLKGIQGSYPAKRVVFDDPVIHMVVFDMGGFAHLGRTDERELGFMQIEFVKRYVSRSRNPSPHVEPLITGREAVPDLLLVGDQEKARSLISNDSVVALRGPDAA